MHWGRGTQGDQLGFKGTLPRVTSGERKGYGGRGGVSQRVMEFAGDVGEILPLPLPPIDANGVGGGRGEGVLHFTEPTINVLRQLTPTKSPSSGTPEPAFFPRP